MVVSDTGRTAVEVETCSRGFCTTSLGTVVPLLPRHTINATTTITMTTTLIMLFDLFIVGIWYYMLYGMASMRRLPTMP